eukprot:SAG11_NODE_12730_length_688_cov_1.130730_1_plen_79_part_00
MAKTRAFQKIKYDRKQREVSALLKPGEFAYLKADGITMPWDNAPSAGALAGAAIVDVELYGVVGTSVRSTGWTVDGTI